MATAKKKAVIQPKSTLPEEAKVLEKARKVSENLDIKVGDKLRLKATLYNLFDPKSNVYFYTDRYVKAEVSSYTLMQIRANLLVPEHDEVESDEDE